MFEPGDRVLVLFPVVGNPLQAKYSGPYKVVKKISDTNYLVKTPGRRKETQVCHINMLKAFHEKPKPELVTLNNRLGLESPTHSKDCVGQVAEKEEDTESEVRLGNDQQPIKLQNSQILNDLGTKLSHLPSVQRKELAGDVENTERLAEKFPGIFPASVVTRSMKAKKEAIKEQGKEEIGLSCTFLENIDGKFEERNKEKADKALMRNETRNVKENIPEKQESESKLVISRQTLIEEQSNDKELIDLFKTALTPVEADKVSVGYLIKKNILMRKWSSHCVTNGPLLLLKEKWLDEDPEKISVLKYVATFKDRLFRAGQMAK